MQKNMLERSKKGVNFFLDKMLFETHQDLMLGLFL